MTTARQILKSKRDDLWCVSPETSVYEALLMMANHDTGGVLVMQENRLLGIFTERDYARKVIIKGKLTKDLTTQEVMTRDLVTVQPGQTIAECMQLMVKRRIRHLPVVDGDNVMGLISIRDVMQAIIAEQQDDIQRLEGLVLSDEPDLLD